MFTIDARKLILAPVLLAAALTSAYADSNLFFYNKDSGLGAITTFSRSQPPTTISTQELSPNWSMVFSGDPADIPDVFFYNGQTGASVLAYADQYGAIHDSLSYGFSPGWSPIVPVTIPVNGLVENVSTLLFYNLQTGLGVTGYIAETGGFVQYPAVFHFSAGWTNIVATDQGMLLFYNAQNGSGAVGYLQSVPDPKCAGQSGYCPTVDKQFVQKTSYAPGSFSPGWTSILETHHGILFYRSSDGLHVMADVDPRNGTVTTRANSTQHLSTGWTSIVADTDNILFYNKDNGNAAIGHILVRSKVSLVPVTKLGTLTTDQSLPQLFSTGWTAVTNIGLTAPSGPPK